ncbi:hypothetical protein LOK49_LG12G02170 [Camellia lanceoleosa]|uniref:Uncharacterized protein n=1 Tax=Camellia lanceoleosa TaxID=1840588 RepID=A0ACC0FTB3_9ERIC|nr:hypothetical protein LOK49_LG12G02170 [Camellia lanceoleosa]
MILHSKGIDLENPVIDVIPSPFTAYTSSSHGSKDVLLCECVRVVGQSRLELGSYASAYQVKLVPSVVIPERLHNKIQICFHQNASRGLCQFDKEFQRWRLFCLAFGFVLLLLAPVVSSWVPFYYSSSMAAGVFLVIIILLFQGMKLLPTGRKNVFHLTLYGSVLGAGSFLLHHFSMLVNSILVSFGLSEEMHNPVSVFVLLGIVVAGAALGYWMVRKFVIAEDGSVDVGVAQFVKWAMRVIASTFIFLCTLDTPLAMGPLASCLSICFLITSFKWNGPDSTITFGNSIYSANGNPWRGRGRTNVRQNRAEFLSRSGMVASRGTLWNSPRRPSGWSDSPVKEVGFMLDLARFLVGRIDLVEDVSCTLSKNVYKVQCMISPTTGSVTKNQQEYFSTFHRTPNRKKFSKKEWENFTQESTRHAVAELASFPKFTDWIIKHADRIQLLPDDSSDNTIGSGSDSTDENHVESGDRFSLCKW